MQNKRIKIRKNHQIIRNIFSIIKLKNISFSLWKKISLFWVIVWIIWLFLNWINNKEHTIDSNWLMWITGSSGLIILILLIILLLILLLRTKKEKIKQYSNFDIQDYILINIIWWFILIISINSIFLINSLKIFENNINYGNWIIINICSAIFIIYSSFIIKKEVLQDSPVFINDSMNNKKDTISEINMKLPI